MTSVMLCLLFITLISQASLSSASSTCNQEDKRVLLQIKKEANNPSFLSSWSPHTDCCDMSWNGVSCGYKTNRVQYITLIGNLANRHAFQIPPSFGNLPRLERLFLFAFPNLTGPIPESISKLTNLMFLTISDTAISGPIPSSLGKLKNLVDLDLSFNKLSGTLPPSLSQLHLLTRMDFDNNKLTGFFLGENSGTIPDSYGSLKNVFTLALSHNQLSGRIPDSLGKMNNLYYVGLSQNRLEGDAYMLFGSNKGTVRMFLSRNMLEFDLGRVELPVNMTTLDVSHNRIYGKLPVGVQNLESLNVSYNRLCGEIPKGGNLQSFNVSSYSHNACLCGVPLPSCK